MTQTHIAKTTDILLPLPPGIHAGGEMAVYAKFMQHLRHVPNSRMEIKVLSAIQFTADMLDCSDAHISKVLIELGLRAPRMAFPAEFLRYADQSLMRGGWEVGGPSDALYELQGHWNAHGEDKFAAFKGDYPLLSAQGVIA